MSYLKEEIMKIHLIGVAGSGMSALAHLLASLGHEITGSDLKGSGSLSQSKPIRAYQGHDPGYVQGKDLIIFSSAVSSQNVELSKARTLGIPAVHRSIVLAELMERKKAIAVSGMHGKTSTTGMVAKICIAGGLDPWVAAGGSFDFLSGNTHFGDGAYSVFEADESDGTLLAYHPEMAIVTYLEPEHMDYFKDIKHILDVFRQFASQVKNKIVLNHDDPGCRDLFSLLPREKCTTFGFSEGADVRGADIRSLAWKSSFRVFFYGKDLGEFVLSIPGRHQVENALAAIAVGLMLGIEGDIVREALRSFQGALRRFQVRGRHKNVTFVDDYAHHPTEIEATLESARLCFPEKFLTIFQPHRYSRTLYFKQEFAKALSKADHTIITDVYPGGENPIPGVNGELIFKEMKAMGCSNVEYIPSFEKIAEMIKKTVFSYEAVLTLGAGNITQWCGQILKDLNQGEENLKFLGKISKDESLSKHTTFRLGGPADFWIEPVNIEELIDVQRWARFKGLPLFVIGNGSNIIVRDGGIRGIVVRLSAPSFRQTRVSGNDLTIGAGLSLTELIQRSLDLGLSGVENLKGIPGTVGGALHFNAGAFGSEIGDMIHQVLALNPDGSLISLSKHQLGLQYRTCLGLKGRIALQATFRLVQCEKREIREKVITLKNTRAFTYPKLPNAGCIFKNPEGDYAGKIIDQLGLKEFSCGEAKISSQHANFIVNTGQAKASDVLTLIEKIRKKVYEAKQIRLENEVEVIGEG